MLSSDLMVSLQRGLEYVLRAVVLPKPALLSGRIKQAGWSCGVVVAHPYGRAEVVRRQEPWDGDDQSLEKHSQFFTRMSVSPAEPAPLRGWAGVRVALQKSWPKCSLRGCS